MRLSGDRDVQKRWLSVTTTAATATTTTTTAVLSSRTARNQGSISSTFYEQLLRSKIPKVKKIQSSCQSFFALLGSMSVKAVRKTLVKLTPGINFIKILQAVIMCSDQKSAKKTIKSFCPLGIWARKRCL